MLKRSTSLYLCCICIIFSVIATTDAQAEYVTYNADDINPAYQKAFGRDAKPDEFAYWSRNDIRYKFRKDVCSGAEGAAADTLIHSECMTASHEQAKYMFLQQLKSYFKTPEGGPELKATIDRSYKAAFNRLPSPEEFAYWQSELKSRTWGYEDLIRAHKKWEQTSVKPEERLAMINKAYNEVYGRPPAQKEIDFWMADIPKRGIIYAELCNYLKDWISGKTGEQIKELENVIKRSYSKAAVKGPNAEQMKTAMNYVTSNRPFFSQLVDWVKKQPATRVPVGAVAPASPIKVPSLKR